MSAFLDQLRAEQARLPTWAPAGAAVLDLPETAYGPLRVAVVPVDPGERAARKVQALQALAPGLRAVARLKDQGPAATTTGDMDEVLTLASGVFGGVTRALEAKTRLWYQTAVWLLSQGVIGLAGPEGPWVPCRPVLDPAQAVVPPADAPADAELRPPVTWFFQLGDGVVLAITERIDALTGVE